MTFRFNGLERAIFVVGCVLGCVFFALSFWDSSLYFWQAVAKNIISICMVLIFFLLMFYRISMTDQILTYGWAIYHKTVAWTEISDVDVWPAFTVRLILRNGKVKSFPAPPLASAEIFIRIEKLKVTQPQK